LISLVEVISLPGIGASGGFSTGRFRLKRKIKNNLVKTREMARTKVQKQQIVSALRDKFSKAKIVLFTSFARENEPGLGVNQIQKLKQDLYDNQAEYSVARKRIIDVAMRATDYKDLTLVNDLTGSVGLVFGYGDVIATSKATYLFSKKNEPLKLLGAILDGELLDAERLIALAQLPGREDLLAKLVGLLSSPMSGLVGVLQGNIRNLVSVLDQIREQKA